MRDILLVILKVSIPQWSDFDVFLVLGLALGVMFQSHSGLILTSSCLRCLRYSTRFQSHSGLILMRPGKYGMLPQKYVSIPQWSDFDTATPPIFSAMSEMFQSHSGLILIPAAINAFSTASLFQSHSGLILMSEVALMRHEEIRFQSHSGLILIDSWPIKAAIVSMFQSHSGLILISTSGFVTLSAVRGFNPTVV